MPINTNDATVLTRFTGLGITCFNPKKKRMETLFIHNEKHKLAIKIFELMSSESVKKEKNSLSETNIYRLVGRSYYKLTKIYSERTLKSNNKESKIVIELKGNKNSVIDSYQIFQAANFDRLDYKTSDRNDFRWIPNVRKENLLSQGEIEPIKNKDFAVSRMYISNAEIFTDKIGVNKRKNPIKFKRVEENSNGSLIENSVKDFGYIAEFIGARSSSETVEFSVNHNGKKDKYTYRKSSKPQCLIEITNSDRDEDSRVSDMEIYRQFWKIPKNEKFDFLNEDEVKTKTNSGGKEIGIRKICNGLYEEDVETIENFTSN